MTDTLVYPKPVVLYFGTSRDEALDGSLPLDNDRYSALTLHKDFDGASMEHDGVICVCLLALERDLARAEQPDGTYRLPTRLVRNNLRWSKFIDRAGAGALAKLLKAKEWALQPFAGEARRFLRRLTMDPDAVIQDEWQPKWADYLLSEGRAARRILRNRVSDPIVAVLSSQARELICGFFLDRPEYKRRPTPEGIDRIAAGLLRCVFQDLAERSSLLEGLEEALPQLSGLLQRQES